MKKVIIILTFVLGFFIYPTVSVAKNNSKTDLVEVDLSPNQPVHKLFPLTLLSIDGKSVQHRDHFIMLEPGEYKLKFFANIDFGYLTRNDKIIRTKVNQRKYSDTLELKVESNNQYQLAFDARSQKVEDWKPIILSVSNKDKN